MQPELVPGVCPLITEPQVKEGEAKNRRTCQWRPAKDDVIHRGYLCRNPVIKNPYLPDAAPTTCGMHVAVCLRPHNDKKGAIEIPNIYGLCTLHHVSEYGAPPVPVPFPYPGMQKRLRDKGWALKPGHWAAPTWIPLPDIALHRYVAPPPPTSFLDKIVTNMKSVLRKQ